MAEGGKNPVAKPMDLDSAGGRNPQSDKTNPRSYKPTIDGEAKRRGREETTGTTRRTGRTEVVATARTKANVAQRVNEWETKLPVTGSATTSSTTSTTQARGLVTHRRNTWEKASEREPDTIPLGVPLPTTPHRERERERERDREQQQQRERERELRELREREREERELRELRERDVYTNHSTHEARTHREELPITPQSEKQGRCSPLVILITFGFLLAFLVKASQHALPTLPEQPNIDPFPGQSEGCACCVPEETGRGKDTCKSCEQLGKEIKALRTQAHEKEHTLQDLRTRVQEAEGLRHNLTQKDMAFTTLLRDKLSLDKAIQFFEKEVAKVKGILDQCHHDLHECHDTEKQHGQSAHSAQSRGQKDPSTPIHNDARYVPPEERTESESPQATDAQGTVKTRRGKIPRRQH